MTACRVVDIRAAKLTGLECQIRTLAHWNCVYVHVQRRQELHVLTCDVFLMVEIEPETLADGSKPGRLCATVGSF